MRNKLIFTVFLSIILLVSLSLTSAGYYKFGEDQENFFKNSFNTKYSYSNPTNYQQNPVYTNTPTITNKISNTEKAKSDYVKIFYGPTYSKKTSLSDSYYQKKSKIIANLDTYSYEQYSGPVTIETNSMELLNQQLQSYSSSSPNPTYYDGGSSFSEYPKYDFSSSGVDTSSSYYYKPTYDSNLGYYNWRY